jgi:hypothetical protein
MSTIVDAMKSELSRLQAEHELWNSEYEAAEAAFVKRLEPYHSHHGEIRRLTEALKILEAE